jgi:hypothetical protein
MQSMNMKLLRVQQNDKELKSDDKISGDKILCVLTGFTNYS